MLDNLHVCDPKSAWPLSMAGFSTSPAFGEDILCERLSKVTPSELGCSLRRERITTKHGTVAYTVLKANENADFQLAIDWRFVNRGIVTDRLLINQAATLKA